MRALMMAVAVASAAVGFVSAGPAWAWGNQGHSVVARVAIGRLEQKHPGITQEIAELYKGGILHRQWKTKVRGKWTWSYCDVGDLDELSRWADCVRYSPKTLLGYSRPYHYDDVRLSVMLTTSTPNTWCDEGCATQKIPEYLQRLRDKTLTRNERAEALAFLVHFVADIHQPLHAEDNGDTGGNNVTFPSLYPPKPNKPPETMTFHSYWDTWLVRRVLGSDGDAIAAVQAAAAQLPVQAGQPSAADLRGWLIGSHELAQRAYGELGLDKTYGAQSLTDPPPDGYVKVFAPDVTRQLALAAVRLEAVLAWALA